MEKPKSTIEKTIEKTIEALSDTQKINTIRKNSIALTIKALRKKAGYTQEQVSAKTNINKQTYSGYENGHNSIPAEVLIRIANLYDVSTDFLIGRTTNPKGVYFQSVGEIPQNEKKELIDTIVTCVINELDKKKALKK